MSSGKVLLGVLAGVAAGALLRVLFAPDKGWNTRKRITKKADEYMDGLREKFDEFLKLLRKKWQRLRRKYQTLQKRMQPKKPGRERG